MLKSITTLNFKKLTDNHFDFTGDLNIICGDNAAGKTTLTQALMFCFFGVKAIPGNSDKIPTWGQKDCSVEVAYGEFHVKRTLKNCSVYKNEKLEVTGNSVCSAYIEEHITGTDLKGFRMLNWSEQGETAALLTMGSTQLQRDVEKFSGVEFIDEMIKLAGVDLRDLRRDLEQFEPKGSEKEIKDEIAKQTKVLESLNKDIMEEEVEAATFDSDKEQAQLLLQDNQKANLRAESGNKKIAVTESELSSATTWHTKHEDKETRLNAEINKLGNVISEASLDSREQQMAIDTTTNADIDRVQASIVQAELDLAVADESLEHDEALAADCQDAQRIYDSDAEEFTEACKLEDKAIDIFDGLNEAVESGICSQCKQPIATEEAMKGYKRDLIDATKNLEKVRESLARKKIAKGQALNQLTTASEKYKSQFKDAVKMKASAELSIVESKEYLDTVEVVDVYDEFSKLKAARTTITLTHQLQQEIDQNNMDLDESRCHLTELQDTLESLKAIELTVTSEKDLEATQVEIRRLETEYNSSKDLIHTAKLELSTMVSDLNQRNADLAAEIFFRKKAAEAKLLSDFVQYLKDSRLRFLTSVWANILGAASGFLMQSSNNVITSLMKSDKDGFMFCEEGVFAPVASASGAQRGFIGVAVRLALAQSLRGSCALVVLDEPTESMREENALRLSGALLGQGQVIMVTHRESDKGVATNVIEL